MTTYRCVVFQSTGNFIPYAGIDFMAASDAMEAYQHMGSVCVERRAADGQWESIIGVWR